ncbi:hypothetical protein HDK77DRAFT_302387 [Phyllosticta capitalensis]|uniref:Uncharacterized protein n=1 Tax=Phyllosticta capitalensis TaxID=121624 RepID=A0ABR1YFC0_9PEZI
MDGPEIVLSKSSDWDLWLFNIKIRATGLGVWDLIDPAKYTKPQGLIEPNRPESLHINQSDLKDNSEYQRDFLNLKIYRLDLEEYRTQQQNLSAISLYIMRTVAPELLSRLAHLVSDHHPWEMMRILSIRLEPTSLERVVDADVGRRSLETSSDETEQKCRLQNAKASDVLELFDKKEIAMAKARKISAALRDDRSIYSYTIISSPADEEWLERIISEVTESKCNSTQDDVDCWRLNTRDLGSLYDYQSSDRPDTPNRHRFYFHLSGLIDDAKTI